MSGAVPCQDAPRELVGPRRKAVLRRQRPQDKRLSLFIAEERELRKAKLISKSKTGEWQPGHAIDETGGWA